MLVADVGMMEWWTSMSVRGHSGGIFAMIIHVVWRIWRHRNYVVFDRASPSAGKIVEKVDRDDPLAKARLIRGERFEEGSEGSLTALSGEWFL
jgi:predicted negative regulator of RcsB-dependent stress response